MSEVKFTLTASSSAYSPSASIQDEPSVQIPTETPADIKELASQGMLNYFDCFYAFASTHDKV